MVQWLLNNWALSAVLQAPLEKYYRTTLRKLSRPEINYHQVAALLHDCVVVFRKNPAPYQVPRHREAIEQILFAHSDLLQPIGGGFLQQGQHNKIELQSK